jgi:hypothetical protein
MKRQRALVYIYILTPHSSLLCLSKPSACLCKQTCAIPINLKYIISMDSYDIYPQLLDAHSPYLCLSHPTDRECLSIWKLTATEWRDALSVSQFLEESRYITSVPLAKDGGMTLWVLVDNRLPPDQRTILSSCETFRKQSLISDSNGNVTEAIIHGVASVFCNPIYRGRGYASRMMRELANVLRGWQTETQRCVGSILYSDIGKRYYAELKWHPFPSTHLEFPPLATPRSLEVTRLASGDLGQLCKEDEVLVRMALNTQSDGKLRMAIVPDHDHMLWHHAKEDFFCERYFGKKPQVKGAIVGQPGSRIWAIWTHRFYSKPQARPSSSTLYILRLVIESQVSGNFSSKDEDLPHDSSERESLVGHLKALLRAAQSEAAQWKLQYVKLWNPSPLVQELIEETGIQHSKVDRDHNSITSLMWYGEGSDKDVEWIANEKYAWC